ncbi:FkbM family methyltransferase [Selenihalanaerobacter shriftii]|uniref:Methyltransferase, FkbM family n=1 Tax=Selenihalanaerobacter shriftii TaxID=142842 RepID=A0A1T4KMY3_9FIRM|nr:FkbM family methyltransferase [Selenihalanaerobacter shriftii]SJZ43761.1 methyltransferase, FkbM family [Selenihalanaerobacter shriftii]
MDNINDFRSELLKEDLYNINAKKYAEKIKNIGKVVIWGSGNGGQLVYNFLKKFDALENIKYYADNSKVKWGTKKNSLLVISPEEVVQEVKESSHICIILASQYLADIKKQLLSLGIEENIIDIKGFGLAKDYWTFKERTPYEIINSHMNDYEKVYSYLSDQRSKKVYLGILNSKISLDNEYLEGVADSEEDQYFDKDIIHLNENEVFCDCGSYNGDTLETFITLSDNKYKKYIAIEADKDIYGELNKRVEDNGYKNVETYNIACWNRKKVLKFQSAQTAGHVTENGDFSVQADTLNNILKDEEVSFLKMDIEGAEEMALKGASRVVGEIKPILAICLYHSLKDYYKLPLIIKNLNFEYKLFIRHYTDMVDTETVCYAIPNSRI